MLCTSQSGLLSHKVFSSDLIKSMECKVEFVAEVHENLEELVGCTHCQLFYDPCDKLPHSALLGVELTSYGEGVLIANMPLVRQQPPENSTFFIIV